MATTKLDDVRRAHPYRDRWLEDEGRMRATYLATRRHLAPFLVPHRFEGKTRPDKLPRARYGHAVGLNRAYLAEIVGHIASAPATYSWTALGGGQDVAEPEGDGLARALWRDATRRNEPWARFFTGPVLEWALSSVGGFLVVDSPAVATATRADDRATGKRPYLRFVPWSAVLDYSYGDDGFRWLKVEETVDERTPNDTGKRSNGLVKNYVLYEIDETGAVASRFDSEGNFKGIANYGELVDIHGRPTLNLVPVHFGIHPDLDVLGTGLLWGLDDIVIDLFNLVSETREGFRDAAFGLLSHRGPGFSVVEAAIKDGSRLVDLGDSASAELGRVAADGSEAQTGLALITQALGNWALSAKRKAAEAVETADARSGVSLQAEFQLDLKPLLTSVTHALDGIEAATMHLVAQMAESRVPGPGEMGVARSTDFRLEDEAERIARLVGDFAKSLPVPPELAAQATVRWVKASGIVAPDATAGEGSEETALEAIERQTRELASARHQGDVRHAEAPVVPVGFPA